jgi:hypothetical protein
VHVFVYVFVFVFVFVFIFSSPEIHACVFLLSPVFVLSFLFVIFSPLDLISSCSEAINLVGRATELFLEYFARECHEVAVSFKKKTITPQHFGNFHFLFVMSRIKSHAPHFDRSHCSADFEA